MISFGYGNAPALLAWRASTWFGLEDAEQAAFRQRLERVHAWHRREQLPGLIAALEEASRRVDREVTIADVAWVAVVLQDHYRETVDRIVDESADLIETLGPAHVAALERRFAESDEEFVEKWIEPPPEKVERNRYERVEKAAEQWLGRLEPGQREWLRERLEALPFDYRAARAERVRRRAELVDLLRDERVTTVRISANAGPRAERLKQWAVDWDRGSDPEGIDRLDRFIREYGRLYVDLVNGATPEQRAHLRDKLASYAEDLSEHLP